MNYIKNFFRSIVISIFIILILSFMLTLINYFDFINYKTVNILLDVIICLSIFIGSLSFGKKSHKKGWIEGIKFSFIFILCFMLMNKFNYNHLIYYFMFILSAIIGSILGINIKKD